MRFPRTAAGVFAVVLACVSFGYAIATVDSGYFPVVSKTMGNDNQTQQVVQPDGKVVIWGTDLVIDGIGKGRVARLNVDGTVDTSFTFCSCLTTLNNIGLLADGKFIAAGASADGNSRVVRLNSDGSQDPNFTTSLGGYQGSSATYMGNAPDGKVYITHGGSLGQGFHSGYLYRLDTNGSTDTTFAAILYDSGRSIWGYARDIEVLPSGKLYFAIAGSSGGSTSAYIRRYNVDGTQDTTWEAPAIGSFGVDIYSISLLPDETLLMGGTFPTVNGVARPNLAKLAPAGNVDIKFFPPNTKGGVSQLAGLSNGKVLYSVNGRLARLNADGSPDSGFSHPSEFTTTWSKFSLGPMERIVVRGVDLVPSHKLFRLESNGSVDNSFNANITTFGQVSVVASQSNAKAVIAGTFNRIGLVSRAGIARLNADGTLDTSFDPGTGFSSLPKAVVVQANGKILVGGSFTSYNGSPVSGLVRLNSDGTLDTAFTPSITGVLGITIQSDDKIFAYGSFTTVNGATRERLVRLNADGTNDTTFTAVISNGSVYSISIEPNGKIVVGGSFTGVEGFSRSNLVRLNINGGIDHSMTAVSIPTIHSVKVLPTGKILCLTGAGGGSGSIIRRNFDGTSDSTFVSPALLMSNVDPRINSMALQADGTIIVGGAFYSIGGAARGNLARLTPNGVVDGLFLTNGASHTVNSLENQPDGKVIVAGQFSRVETSVRAGVARIVPGAFVRVTPFDFDGDGRADVSVFRASEGRWYILQSGDLTMRQVNFAIAGDVPTPADFDGDGKTDVAIYRPSNGDWWSLSSSTGQQINGSFGQTNGTPLPSDYNGDGRADYIIYRPATGYWSRISSATGEGFDRSFGAPGDKPVIGDFNGDGMSDVAIYRPSDGNWWWWSSSDNIQRATRWGIAEDIADAADYTGDGRSDFAVFRPSTGVWYIYDAANNSSIIYPFGTAGDRPVSGDYDGDGRADTSVFRPTTGVWYVLRTTAGYTGYQWGIATDSAIPNVYVPQ